NFLRPLKLGPPIWLIVIDLQGIGKHILYEALPHSSIPNPIPRWPGRPQSLTSEEDKALVAYLGLAFKEYFGCNIWLRDPKRP
ncbi:hypothetical protein MKX08_000213, partial [Trichoderma sp. CBMAI-0020]